MKVNLKKAAALASAVAAIGVKFDHVYATDVYGDAPNEDTVEKLNTVLVNQLNNALALVEVVYTLRTIISAANIASGINELLTLRAKNEKQLAVLNSIPVRNTPPNLARISLQLEAAKNPEGKGYLAAKAPTMELETASLLLPILSACKKQKRKLDEELQSLNFRTEIELPENVVQVLTDLDLI